MSSLQAGLWTDQIPKAETEMMEYGDIGIKDEDDILEAMKVGAYAEQLYEFYGDRIIGLLLAALDKKFHGKTWGMKQWESEKKDNG